MTAADPTIAAVRRFSRFYTRAVGALDRAFLGSPYTLAEMRVLYEIAHGHGVTPKSIGQTLRLDPGYLSRILRRLERDGLVSRTRSASDGRSVSLSLSRLGRETFDRHDARQQAHVAGLLTHLAPPEQARLVRALGEARHLLESTAPAAPVMLRRHQAGDMGWVVERHAALYGAEYGWGSGIEAVTARIVADFLEHHDPARERCWIAERDGVRLGSVFLVKESETVARLRLLLLEPSARGEGLGRRLVDACIAFAREAGYHEMVLWTHQVLTAARKIYAAAGFRLEETWTHEEFGALEVSETWRLKL